jgi:hypothetical protein
MHPPPHILEKTVPQCIYYTRALLYSLLRGFEDIYIYILCIYYKKPPWSSDCFFRINRFALSSIPGTNSQTLVYLLQKVELVYFLQKVELVYLLQKVTVELWILRIRTVSNTINNNDKYTTKKPLWSFKFWEFVPSRTRWLARKSPTNSQKKKNLRICTVSRKVVGQKSATNSQKSAP